MCDSGLRRGEIINLQIGNVHLARGFMIVTGKGDKQRFVPLGELSKISLATYIRKYRNEAKESEPVFVNRFGEKCKSFSIVIISIQAGTFEIILIIQKIVDNAIVIGLKHAAIKTAPR